MAGYDDKPLTVYVTNSSDPLDTARHHVCQRVSSLDTDGYGVQRLGCRSASIGRSVIIYRDDNYMYLYEVKIKGHQFRGE